MNVKEREKLNAKKMHCHPRTLARKIAHEKFKNKGYDNVNKKFVYKGNIFSSYFATHWRGIISDG